MRKSVYFFWFLFCMDIAAPAQHLPITVYNPMNGALVNGAISIFQDNKGWMWFVSGYDVIRYDGYQFRIFPPAAGTRMDFCYQVMQVDDEVWILSNPYPLKVRGDSLYRVDLGNFKEELIQSFRYANKQYIVSRSGLYTYEKGRFSPFITAPGLNISDAVRAPVLFRDSLLFAWKTNEELIVVDLKNKGLHRIPEPIIDIQQDGQSGVYFLIKGKGIHKFKGLASQSGMTYLQSEMVLFVPSERIQIAMDHEHNLWISNQGNNLQRLRVGGEVETYTMTDGLPHSEFNSLFIDREGSLWLAFPNGLCKIIRSTWTRYTSEQGLASNYVLFFENGPGDDFFISTSNGLTVFDDNKMHPVKKQGNAFICTQIIMLDQSNCYFSRDSALYSAVYNPENYTIESEKKLASFPGPVIQVVKNKQDDLFIATTHGLFGYQDKIGVTKRGDDSGYYRYLFMDEQSRLWAGEFSEGLHGFHINYSADGRVQFREFLDIDSIRFIRAITMDKRGNLLVGTRYNSFYNVELSGDKLKAVKHFSGMEGVRSNNTWGAVTDQSGAFWIANSRGLIRVYRENNSWIVKDEGSSRQVYQATHVFAARDNRVWVASYPGIMAIKNDSLTLPAFSVMITNVSVNGVTQDPFRGARFSWRQNNLNIEFSSNTFLDENRVLYSYQLSTGHEGEWSLPAPIHSINFSSLSPGNYTFRARAVNINGQVSQDEAYYAFSILPPFWKRTWFFIAVILVTVFGLYALYRYRVKRIRELFEMRNVIASDLHDEIGSGLTSIHILSQVSKNNLQKDPGKTSSMLNQVIEQSEQIQQNMSDIVWAIKPDNDKMEHMIARMREYISYTLEPKNISTSFEIGENIAKEKLDMQQRRDFFLIFKEAVNNIAKYAGASEVRIQVDRQKENISLLIQDNGKGFSMPPTHASNGLNNMKKRAVELGGSIRIDPVPGKGVSIELRFPATS